MSEVIHIVIRTSNQSIVDVFMSDVDAHQYIEQVGGQSDMHVTAFQVNQPHRTITQLEEAMSAPPTVVQPANYQAILAQTSAYPIGARVDFHGVDNWTGSAKLIESGSGVITHIHPAVGSRHEARLAYNILKDNNSATFMYHDEIIGFTKMANSSKI